MQPPKIEIIPARPAVCCDEPTTLDVLVRIIPPVPDVHFLRPPVNLAIVLDRSGSMAAERKMEHAREAAAFAITQLLPTDRVSVTIYDEMIETIAPSALVVDKPGLLARIRAIVPRGSTDLHKGWAAGAEQVIQHVNWDGLNRVLLLSDGQANIGLTEPKAIGAEVRAMAGNRVSTSAMGVGKDYNEDLMEAIADAGDGNYYYVESALQLADIFQTELQGLMATSGRDVGLTITPARGDVDVKILNELEHDGSGRYKLPNLVVGMPLSILVRLTVGPQRGFAQTCQFQVDWEEPGTVRAGRRNLIVALDMPAVTARAWSEMPIDPVVAEYLTLHLATLARKEMIAAIDRGDEATTRSLTQRILDLTATVPQTLEIVAERASAQETMEWLNQRDMDSARKVSHQQQYLRKSGRSSPPPQSK